MLIKSHTANKHGLRLRLKSYLEVRKINKEIKTSLSLSSGFVRCVQFMARVNSRKSNEPLPSSSKTLKIYYK